jgi:nitrogen fixation-related uncharacterized protein
MAIIIHKTFGGRPKLVTAPGVTGGKVSSSGGMYAILCLVLWCLITVWWTILWGIQWGQLDDPVGPVVAAAPGPQGWGNAFSILLP